MNAPYLLTQLGFIALTVIFYGLFLKEFKAGLAACGFAPDRQRRIFSRIIIVLVVWAIFISVWSGLGVMSNFSLFPLNMAPVVAIPLITILIFSFSKTTKEIIVHIPQQNLIRLQSFRLFVELLLWWLFVQNLMPVQMSFEGRNFDVLSGISAPIIAWLVAGQKISKPVLVVWNIMCLGLLVNIVSIAILSMPTPFQVFTNEPVNMIVTLFPISWLPGFLVPLAYGLHFLSFSQLSGKKLDKRRL